MPMPDAGSALYVKMVNDATISGIVGTEVYDLIAPEEATLPYVVFYQADGRLPNWCKVEHLDDVWRVDSWAETLAGAKALHNAVFDCLHGGTLSMTGWTTYWMVCDRQQKFVEGESTGEQIYRLVWDVHIKASQ